MAVSHMLAALRSSRRCFSMAHKAVKCGHTALGRKLRTWPACDYVTKVTCAAISMPIQR